jgi:hypothetical protein
MKISQLISESRPRTLYHGTLKEFVPDILDLGLLPRVGRFTAHAYDEYRQAGIPLENVVFAADRQNLGKCVSAIIGQMRHHYPQWHWQHGPEELTADDFYHKAALLVLTAAEPRWQQHSDHNMAQHPVTAEPDDWYIRGADLPNMVLTDDRLRNFLRRNSIRLADYGIHDPNIDRAELIRQGLQPRPR